MAAAGAEHDAAVGRVHRLDVVVRSVRQLPESVPSTSISYRWYAVGAARAVREQDLLSVVMYLRIADPAARVIQQDLQPASPQVQAAQAAAFSKSEPLPIAFEQRRAV